MLRSLRWLLASSLLLTSPSAGRAQDPPQPLQSPVTLPQLVEAALAGNRPLKIAASLADKAAADIQAARTRQWPDFSLQVFSGPTSPYDFTFPTGAFGTFATTGPVPPQETKVHSVSRVSTVLWFQASQPLTQLGRVRANVRQLEYERDVLEERRRARAQAVAGDVRRQYYAVLEAQSAVAAADAGVSLYRELARVAREQRDAKTIFEADLLTTQAELARREHAATTARGALATAREQLAAIVGRDLPLDLVFVPVEGMPDTPVDLAGAEAKALRQRPEVREAALKVEQARQGINAKKAERIPEVSLAMRFIGFNNVEVLPTMVTAVGLSATWQPFDWGRKRSEIAAGEHTLAAAGQALEEAQTQVRTDVRARYRKLAEVRQLITVAELLRKAADQRLQLTRSRFEAQSAMRGDVLQAEAALAEADRDYRRTVLACWTAQADLQLAIGEM
jgi:cobalt-zinc-cadmium efflux system outer membrane protein